MNNTVDIEFVPDENYIYPNVTIRAKEKTKLVENIIHAVENVSEDQFSSVSAYDGSEVILLSQRDIIRARSYDHRVVVQTETGSYLVKKTLIALEEMLDPKRFLRISHSELVNLYKIRSFDFNIRGSIAIRFENGDTSWASRRYLRSIREFLK